MPQRVRAGRAPRLSGVGALGGKGPRKVACCRAPACEPLASKGGRACCNTISGSISLHQGPSRQRPSSAARRARTH